VNDKEEFADYDFDYVECPECGEEVRLSAPYLFGDDADGNRGEMRQDMDEDHICLTTEERELTSND
jgi:hypothetical protein